MMRRLMVRPAVRRDRRGRPVMAVSAILMLLVVLVSLAAALMSQRRAIDDGIAGTAVRLSERLVERAAATLTVADGAAFDAISLLVRHREGQEVPAGTTAADLRRRIAGFPGTIGLAVFDALGAPVGSAGQATFPPGWIDEQLRRHRDQWLEPDIQPLPSGHAVTVSRGVWSDDGGFLGFTVAVVGFGRIVEDFATDSAAVHARMLLTLADGRLLLSEQGALAGPRSAGTTAWQPPRALMDLWTGAPSSLHPSSGPRVGDVVVAARLARDIPLRGYVQIAVAPYHAGWAKVAAAVAAAALALTIVVVGFLVVWSRAERARARAERALATSDERLGFALENTRLGLWDWSVPSGMVYYSSRSMVMLGYEPGTWEPSIDTFFDLLHPEDVEAVSERLRGHIEGGDPDYRAEFRMRRADGTWTWILAHGRIVEIGPDGRAQRLIGTIQDVTDRRERELALEEAATLDPLLGIRNRRCYERRATAVVSRALRQGLPLSLVMIDLDHFKAVNDHYGHEAGDEALKTLCRALEVELRHEDRDMLFRLGGEEFVVVLADTDIARATHIGERLRLRVEQTPVLYEDRRFSMTASFGVAGWRRDEEGLEGALRRADTALYAAKAQGRNRVSVHASHMPPHLTVVKG